VSGAPILSVAALAVLLGYAPPLAAPFVPVKLAALVLAGALGMAIQLNAQVRGGTRPRLDPAVLGSGAAVLLTTALSALAVAGRPPGAPYATLALIRWAAVAGLALGVAALDRTERTRLADAIQIGAGLVALLGLAQHLGICPLPIPSISVPGSTFGNRNLAAEAVAVALPFGLARAHRTDADGVRGPMAAVLALLQLAFLAAARTRGAWIGGLAGLLVFAAVARPRLSRRSLAVIGTCALVAIGAAAIPGRWTAHDAGDAKRFASAAEVVREGVSLGSPVARTRLGLWRRAWTMFGTAPGLGVGPGNFAVLFPRYAEPGATADGVLSPTRAPRQVHDDLLERLTETGLVGLAALAALYAALAVAEGRRARLADGDDRRFAAGCAGAVAAFIGCGLTGFPMSMPATLFLFGVAAGALAARHDRPALTARAPGVARAGAWTLGAILIVQAAVWSARLLAGSLFLGRAERTLAAGDGPELAARALPDLARAARARPRDFDVALRTAYAAWRAGRPAQAATAAARALAVESESPNAWEALARARLDLGDAAGAAAAAGQALSRLHDYPAARGTRDQAARRLAEERR